jgi:hypothetical protein
VILETLTPATIERRLNTTSPATRWKWIRSLQMQRMADRLTVMAASIFEGKSFYRFLHAVS